MVPVQLPIGSVVTENIDRPGGPLVSKKFSLRGSFFFLAGHIMISSRVSNISNPRPSNP